MKKIVNFSGGKDSTAMLLRMIELNMPIDEIRYFDCGSWEFPQMHNHIKKVEEYIEKPIKWMKYKYDFDYLFSKKVTSKGFEGYGFPSMNYRWCTGRKKEVLNKGISKEDILYIAFSIEELGRMQNAIRINKQRKNKIFPLIGWGWDNKDCLEYCYSKGFDWEGLYNYFDRVSCWCCPFQGLNSLRNLRKYFPEFWQRLLNMQKERMEKYKGLKNNCMSINFRMDGQTVFDLDQRFKEEERQMEMF